MSPIPKRDAELSKNTGGATAVPQWGKVWLALLNLYSWSAVNPIPPEFWLLPDWVPFHPWRWWVQCRVVYLPVSYLYANKVTKPLNPLLQSLRQEIFTRPFEEIDFQPLSKHNSS